ncbi:hypothetical protein PAAG_01514 [Paracoccidioides lutzii Pb01]|uniref:DAGKc domain-containing protein n=1 Tax=Paracoccidioides lutzii (strain ATCC MYA-826 / Pb01) TaxID=502779 RepID=C1GSL9_PARBA|nr:hypothetical protein PAAG_01514 [Paracoccidioides lutzii Pb01]EEH39052.1 hypothetical protein PAAG_01514 [Paracoccidioides lutzii Pb01]
MGPTSIPSIGLVELSSVSYDSSSESLTWTGEGSSGKEHTVQRSQIVAIVPCPENKKLLSYIWLEDSISPPSSSALDEQREQQYLLKRFESAGECPAPLSKFIFKPPPPHRHKPHHHLYPAKSSTTTTTTTTANEPNLHIIISTKSGTQRASSFYATALKPLLAFLNLTEHNDYSTHLTQSPQTITQLAQCIFLPRARLGIEQTIILLAGDGGLVDVIKVLLSECSSSDVFRCPVVCLVPMGTGNATANSAEIISGRDATGGLRVLVGGVAKGLPMFRVGFSEGARYVTDEGRGREPICGTGDRGGGGGEGGKGLEIFGVVVFSWGMHASLVADSDTAEYRRFGRERFHMAAKELLFPSDGSPAHVYKGQVTVTPTTKGKGEVLQTRRPLKQTEHMYVLATLCSTLEEGFTISPESRPLDGRLRFVYFGPLRSEEIMEIMQLAAQGGRHVVEKRDVVGYEEVEGVRVDFCEGEREERWRRVCVDGTIVVVEDGGWVEVKKGGGREVVRLVVPVGNGDGERG